MKILILCEFSGRVRDEFLKLGHDAISCDLLPTESPGPHIQGDIKKLGGFHFWTRFDLVIAHPPCTYLCSSGARWWKDKRKEQEDAIRFIMWISNLPVLKIAIENPVGILSSVWRKPDQIVHPWMFGINNETKSTCLWLKGLPKLVPNNPLPPPHIARVHNESPGPDRWKRRSITDLGMAVQMAQQWGKS